jgi:hypothetical protein
MGIPSSPAVSPDLVFPENSVQKGRASGHRDPTGPITAFNCSELLDYDFTADVKKWVEEISLQDFGFSGVTVFGVLKAGSGGVFGKKNSL